MPRILIADDDTLIRRFLQQALEFGGYEVISAADGAEAITILDRESGVHVVVTDYSMPRASGLDVIAHAQRIDPTLPCIIVTAFRDLDLAMKGMQAGAVGFIPKPFKADHLLTVVRRAVERRELATEALRLRLLTPMLERFTMVLSNTLESKDLSTWHHSERLVTLSDRIARALGLEPQPRSWIRLGACLHDIGKVGIPEHLLQKATALTVDERDLMRQHPQIGASILEDIDSFDEVRQIVLHHHEHFDGSGYPSGLRGATIPIGARIVCVVDAFDVMRAGRPYARARALEEILGEYRSLRGRQFDPEIVDVFLGILETSGAEILEQYEHLIPPRLTAAADDDIPGWLQPHHFGLDGGARTA
jgi:putative two-component system response regulator